MLLEDSGNFSAPVIPAVDVLDGEAVRLVEGRFDEVGVRAGDPITLVKRFAATRPPYIHLVDLIAARDGGVRPELVACAVAAAGNVPLQVAGGVRSVRDARALRDAGAARVVVGTAAFGGELRSFVDALGDRLVVAVDVRGERVLVSGWLELTELTVAAALETCAAAGVSTVMCTATDRDGTLAGPDLRLLSTVRGAWAGGLIAAGGIRSREDVEALAELGVDAVVVGRALLPE